MMGTSVKTERHDDAEINEMARRIIEQNRQKSGQQAGMPPMGYPPHAGQMAMSNRPGQPTIQNYLTNPNGMHLVNNNQQKAGSSGSEVVKKDVAIDEESKKGRFGWGEFEKNPIPYILRVSGEKTEKYTSVRMVERKLLNKFLSVLPTEVNSCHCIRSYYITDSEAKLLNEINIKHTDLHFGKEAFTTKDLVVKIAEAKEFYRFLDLCYKKLVLKKSNASDKCGFFRINRESVVPYTVKDTIKYVPLFYFEGETDHLKLKSDSVDSWDLAYLKFCCKVQGIRNELFAADTCRVVALEEIRGHFPSGTTFEDYWPAKGSIEPVHHSQRVSAGNWTQKPVSVVPQNHAAHPASAAHQNNSAQQPPAAHSRTNYTSQQATAQQQQQQSAMASYAQQLNSVAAAAGLAAQRNYASTYERQLLQQMGQAQAAAMTAAAVRQQQQMLQAAYAGHAGQQAAAAQAAAAQQQQAQSQHRSTNSSSQPAVNNEKAFNGKLTQIKEFPMEQSHQPPYKLQKALIDQKIVPCINVRPYVFHDLMMTLPDFVKHFYPDLTVEKARQMLQDILKVVLYKGNSGHQEILRAEGKCTRFDPVPLVLVKDIMNYMPQMKYMFANVASTNSDPAAKRMKLS